MLERGREQKGWEWNMYDDGMDMEWDMDGFRCDGIELPYF